MSKWTRNNTQFYFAHIAGEDVTFLVTYSFHPGTADVRYLLNGDPGYPGDPAEIDYEDIKVLVDETEGAEKYEAVPDWLMAILVRSDDMYNYLMENHEDDYDDRADYEYDRMRDEQITEGREV